jgi:hypothetical protein
VLRCVVISLDEAHTGCCTRGTVSFPRITNVKDGQEIRTWDKDGIFDLEGTYENARQSYTFALSFSNGRWYFQPHAVRESMKAKKKMEDKILFWGFTVR